MALQILFTTVWLSAIIAVRYVAVAGCAYWVFWGPGRGGEIRRGRFHRLAGRPPSARAIRHEVTASLISTPIYALPAAAAWIGSRYGITRIYVDPGQYGLIWLPLSALIYLLAHDAFYYWLHRGMHHPRLFAWSHRGHHRSRDPTPFASFSFDPAEAAMTAWFLPALTLIVPIHVGIALALLTLMTLTAVLNHAGQEIWPQRWLDHPVGRWVITARHHDGHHKRFNANYGLYFRFWDRLAGTDRD